MHEWTDKLGDYQRTYNEPAAAITWVRIMRPSTQSTLTRQFRNPVTAQEISDWMDNQFPGWILWQAW